MPWLPFVPTLTLLIVVGSAAQWLGVRWPEAGAAGRMNSNFGRSVSCEGTSMAGSGRMDRKRATQQIGLRSAHAQQFRYQFGLLDRPSDAQTMDARLQRRVQRYGWDLAADDYEPLWQAQLAEAQAAMMALASPAPGDRVLDIACGTGLVSFEAARAVGPDGHVLGVDISGRMVRFRRTTSEGSEVIELQLCAHGCRDAGSAGRQLRRRVVRPWAHVHARPGTGPAGDAPGTDGQEVASLLPCGANDRSADGQRFSESSMPR